MSDDAPPAAAAAAQHDEEDDASGGLNGSDIARVLTSSGPVVTCVLLRHMRKDAKDVKPHPANAKVDTMHRKEVLTELIEEIEVDTTPAKNAIKGILGPFTFIGQFPTEGVVAMARRELPDDLRSQSISTLRALCADVDMNTQGMLEKQEMVQALESTLLPVNPHKLQPPLDGLTVRGDILLLRVAETEETLDEPNNDTDEEEEEKEMKMLSNDEFFLNYSKDEYVAFASRTDVVAPKVEHDDDEDEEEDDDEDGQKRAARDEDDDEEEDDEGEEGDEDFNPSNDEDPDEEEKSAMLNLIMAEVLRKFREEKGRGPTSEELLELRRQVAAPLGVEVTTVDDISSKRSAEDEESRAAKRVKFGGPEEGNDNEEEEDKKPVAVPADDGGDDKEEKKGDSESES